MYPKLANEFATEFAALGGAVVTGVPDSTTAPLQKILMADERLVWIDAVREDLAIGVAGGAWLAGKIPLVIMQNSGLGYSLNALTSFACIYKIGMVLLIGWRGGENDAPEHLIAGRALPALLEAAEVPWRQLYAETMTADLSWAFSTAIGRPCALVVRPGVF